MSWECLTCDASHPGRFSFCPRSGEARPRPGSSSENLKPSRVKAALDLLPVRPLRAISAALYHGALKYEPWNWMQQNGDVEIAEQKAALRRHIGSYLDPSESDLDDDSGLHHLAHAGANVLMLLWHEGVDYVKPRIPS